MDLFFFEQFVELRFHGAGPDAIAAFAGMQRIGHDVHRNSTVALNQLRAKIETENVLAVVEFGERLIHLQNFATLDAEGFPAREVATIPAQR